MSGAHHARCTVNVHTDVALVGDHRLTRVNAHPNSDTGRLERVLTRVSCGYGVAGARKCVEERVALGIDLDSSVPAERFAQQPPVLREDGGVLIAELVEQARGAIDVREQERHRPAR